MKFSVIIPAYNSEKTLARCIDSVLRQKYQDFETIIIDDGSQDKTASIIKSYQGKDSRIMGITKENGGASSARNFGIKHAKGEYIVFIDSDDEVTYDYLSDLAGSNEDCILSGVKIIAKNSQHDECPDGNHHLEIEDLPNFIEINNTQSFLRGPYAKALKRKIIEQNGIEFDPNIIWGEDFLFVLKFLKHASSIRTVNKSNYIYYWPPDGVRYKMTSRRYLYGLYQIEKTLKTFGDIKNSILNNRRMHYETFLSYFCSLSFQKKIQNLSTLFPFKLWKILPDISFYYKATRYVEIVRVTIFIAHGHPRNSSK